MAGACAVPQGLAPGGPGPGGDGLGRQPLGERRQAVEGAADDPAQAALGQPFAQPVDRDGAAVGGGLDQLGVGELPALAEAPEPAVHEPSLADREAALQRVAAGTEEGELDPQARGLGVDPRRRPPATGRVVTVDQDLERHGIAFGGIRQGRQRLRVDQADRQVGHQVEPPRLGPAQEAGQPAHRGRADARQALHGCEQREERFRPRAVADLLCRTPVRVQFGFR